VTTTDLYEIDTETAAVTHIGPTEQSLSGLEFSADDRLIGAGDGLFVLDSEQGGISEVLVAPEREYKTSGDLALRRDGQMYWTVWFPTEPDDLMLFDLETRELTKVGTMARSGVYGISVLENTLYGVDLDGRLLKFNTGPLQEQLLERRSQTSWVGAAAIR